MSDHSSVNDDYDFVDLVYDDIKKFLANPHGERALLFPAVNPRRRYLIHNTVQENFPQLTTLSVGQGDQRRTAVTFKKNFNRDADAGEAKLKRQQSGGDSSFSNKTSTPCTVGAPKQEESNGRLPSVKGEPPDPSGSRTTTSSSVTSNSQSQGQPQGHSKHQSNNSTSTIAAQQQQQPPPKKPEEKSTDRPVREGRRPEQLLYSPQRQGSLHKIDIRREALQQSANRHQQSEQTSQRQHLQKQRSQDQQQQTGSQQRQPPQQRQQNRSSEPHQSPAIGSNNRAQENRSNRIETAVPPKQQQQQRQRKHRSRSCNSDTRSSSSIHSIVEASRDRLGNEDDLMRDSGAEETQQGNANSCGSSRKRRNRRNRRHKDRAPPNNTAADQGGGTDGGGGGGGSRPPGREVSERSSPALGAGKTAVPDSSVHNTHNNKSVIRSVDVLGDDLQKSVGSDSNVGSVGSDSVVGSAGSDTNPVCSNRGSELRGCAVPRSSEIASDNNSSATGHHLASRRKYMKSYEEVENWRDACGTNRHSTARSPPSSRRESESSSPCDTFAKNSPERMPVTVPSASDQGNNRRRSKAPAQIYRPPPARSNRETVQQNPQQMQPHQPLYSQPYQPKPNFSPSPYHPQHHHSPNYPPQNVYSSQHNYHQQDFHHYNSLPNRQRTDSESSTATTSGDYLNNKGKGRRPDQVLYVPRGRRHNPDPASARGTPTPVLDYENNGRPPSPAYSICSVASEFSGRNRYNKQGSRQGSQISIYEGETDRLQSKPPLSRDYSRESTPGYGKQKAGTLFSSQTLQLIERCLNHDADNRFNEYSNGESDAVHGSPSPKNKLGNGRPMKSPTPTRDIHSIHSKENVIHPIDSTPRSRRSRKNRRRNSRSRDTSADQYKDGHGKSSANLNGDYSNSPGERGLGSCERIFYNSNFNSSQERYDRGYDNYDRYSSINSSRASSRNSSRERTPQYSPQHNWRVGSNPPSPTKGPMVFYQNRHSSAKPPSGRLGSLPNVALDFGESPKRVSNCNEENQRYHTLPVKSRTPVRGNSLQTENKEDIEYTSGCITSERIDASSVNGESSSDLTHQDDKSLENLKEEITKNIMNTSRNSTHSEPMISEVAHDKEINHSSESEVLERMEDDSAHETSVSKDGLLSSSVEECKINDEKEAKDDAMNKSIDGIMSGTASEEDAFEMEAEASLTESAKDSTEEVTSSDNDTKVDDNDSKNIKKFQFNWADEVEDSWDSLYDDNGECLNSEIKRQLSDSLGKIKLEKPANDYYSFQPKEPEINEEEYGHVIEIYDFPVSFKTQDLMMVFSSFHNTGFDIKWVDDTHALGIFATALIAAEALSIDHPFLKTRSLALATKSSKAKALRITEALLPYKPRPATSASLARRLVSGALGLKVNISREVREAEKQKLKDAKAQKRLAAKQRADAWEGTLS